MKNSFVFFAALFLLASCEEKKSEVNTDSLSADSALKAMKQMTIPKTDHDPDTLHMVTLPPVLEGDMVFQVREDEQLEAFGAATKSKYNNIGIIFIHPRTNLYMVVEARDSVRLTPLTEWVDAGKGQHVALVRLKNANILLNAKKTKALKSAIRPMKGIPYDPYFSWSNEGMYPSEMVWKVYNQGPKLDLCEPRKLSDLDLTGSLVAARMKSKYGTAIPKDEKVVTPDDIYNSPKVEVIYEK